MELSGIVNGIGKDVSRFKVGDEVMASTVFSGFGGYAEYKTMKEDGLIVKKPSNLSFEEAAVLPNGGFTALGILKLANIKKGQKVLIYGASGSVGTFSIQIAKHMGAIVTGITSTANLDLISTIGAQKVIDYTKSDLSKIFYRFDVIFDAVGKGDPKVLKGLLKKGGIYLNVHTSSDRIKKKEMLPLLRELKGMAESGTLKPVIDRNYPLEKIVEAHRYVDRGHKKGNIAVVVSNDNQGEYH
jgi:NADPH:quinone reductase-like Zn-dependent oxidoreductase